MLHHIQLFSRKRTILPRLPSKQLVIKIHSMTHKGKWGAVESSFVKVFRYREQFDGLLHHNKEVKLRTMLN